MPLADDCYNPRHLNQIAVYWARTGNTRGGQPAYDTPVEVQCRWDEETVEFFAPDGRKLTSKAVVMIGEDLAVGGALNHCRLVDLTDMNFPFNPDNPKAWEILGWIKTANNPNAVITKYVREVFL